MAGSAAEMEATWAISDLSSISLAWLSMSFDGGRDGLLDAPLEAERAGAGGHVAEALADERLGQHGGGGGAVTGDVVGLGGDLLHELGTHVLEGVVELDLTSDGHTVVGDGGGAELLLEHHVAALRAERDLDGVGQLVDAGLEGAAGVVVELEDLGHRCLLDDREDVAAVEDEHVLAVDR